MSGVGRREKRRRKLQHDSAVMARETPPPHSITERAVLQTWKWQAPLPAPPDLQAYDQILPGAAERLLALVERQNAMAMAQMEHRHQVDRDLVKSRVVLARRGQLCALTIAMTGMGVAGMAIYLGQGLAGLASMLVPLATLVSFFFGDRKKQGEELEAKRRDLERAAEMLAKQP